MPARNRIIFRIQNWCLWTVLDNAFETAKFWFTVGLTAILCLLQRKNPTFKKGLSPESCLSICHRGLVAYKAVTYKKNKCNRFLINAALLNVYFILRYHSIYFYIKKFIFFECLYFSKYDIGMYLYVFWLRKGSSIKCVRKWWGDWRFHPKRVKLRIGGASVTPHVYVSTNTISFHIFGSIFVWYVSFYL